MGDGILTQNKAIDISEARRPETKKQIRSFLGMVGFYWRFIPQFAEIALPLTSLMEKCKPKKLVWEDEHQRAFERQRLHGECTYLEIA